MEFTDHTLGSAALLPVSYFAPPRYRDKWIAPVALKRVSDVVRDYRIVLLHSLPGAGKTRFMAQLQIEFQAVRRTCCWLRISPVLETAEALALAICQVLARSALGNRSATSAMLMNAGAIDPGTLLTVALNEVAGVEQQVTLFLDDTHLIDTPSKWLVLQKLIDEGSNNLQIIIASRTPIPIKLGRLHADGTLLSFTPEDFHLTFNQTEQIAVDLLGDARPDLPLIRMLYSETQGWVTGIRICCDAIRRQRRGGKGTDTNFELNRIDLNYFKEELLCGLTPEARRALPTMLLPHRLERELMLDICDAPSPEACLKEYEEQGLLAQATIGGGTYRPAPLLRLFARENPTVDGGTIRALHRRCCDWFESRDILSLAAAHAVDGHDMSRAADLVDKCGMSMIEGGKVAHLQKCLNRLPVEMLRDKPTALLCAAWALSLLYRLDEAALLINLVDDDIHKNNDGSADALDANVGALKVMHLAMQDNISMAITAARLWNKRHRHDNRWCTYVIDNALCFSLAQLGQFDQARLVLDYAYLPNFHARAPYAAVYSRCILGLVDLFEGKVRNAEAHFSWSLRTAERLAGPESTGAVMSAGLLAGARYERNDLAGAQRLIDTYAWSMHEHLFVDARFFAYRTLARMENQRRQRRMAISTLERILDVQCSTRWVRMHVDTLAEKVHVALEQMNFRMARAYIDSIADQIETLMPDEEPWRGYLEAMLAVCEAELAIVTGQPTQAIELLIPIIKSDFRSHWRLRAIQRSVLLVRALWRSGREAASVILLNRIMDIAASDGIFRSLLDGGPDIALVLNLSIQRSAGLKTENRNRRRYIEALRDAFEPCGVDGPAEVREAKREQDNLTEREKELVRLTKTGMTNREIAKLMQVSENTIKWHLKNVFEKLGVSRRSELLAISL